MNPIDVWPRLLAQVMGAMTLLLCGVGAMAGELPAHTPGTHGRVTLPHVDPNLIDAKAIRDATGYGNLSTDDMRAAVFDVLVPDGYKRSVPYGLVVDISPEAVEDDQSLYMDDLATHRLIYVTLSPDKDATKSFNGFRRICMGLMALSNIPQLYTIDPERVYLLSRTNETGHIETSYDGNITIRTTVGPDDRDMGLRMAFGYPQLISGLLHMGRMPYWENIGRHLAALDKPSSETLERVKPVRFLLYPDRQNDNVKGYLRDLGSDLKGDGLDADSRIVDHDRDGVQPNLGDMFPHADGQLYADLKDVRLITSRHEKAADFGAALLLWHRAEMWGNNIAPRERKRLETILAKQTEKARRYYAEGDERKGRKLATKIDEVFGLFAWEARELLAPPKPDKRRAAARPPVGHAPPVGDAPAPPVGD